MSKSETILYENKEYIAIWDKYDRTRENAEGILLDEFPNDVIPNDKIYKSVNASIRNADGTYTYSGRCVFPFLMGLGNESIMNGKKKNIGIFKKNKLIYGITEESKSIFNEIQTLYCLGNFNYDENSTEKQIQFQTISIRNSLNNIEKYNNEVHIIYYNEQNMEKIFYRIIISENTVSIIDENNLETPIEDVFLLQKLLKYKNIFSEEITKYRDLKKEFNDDRIFFTREMIDNIIDYNTSINNKIYHYNNRRYRGEIIKYKELIKDQNNIQGISLNKIQTTDVLLCTNCIVNDKDFETVARGRYKIPFLHGNGVMSTNSSTNSSTNRILHIGYFQQDQFQYGFIFNLIFEYSYIDEYGLLISFLRTYKIYEIFILNDFNTEHVKYIISGNKVFISIWDYGYLKLYYEITDSDLKKKILKYISIFDEKKKIYIK